MMVQIEADITPQTQIRIRSETPGHLVLELRGGGLDTVILLRMGDAELEHFMECAGAYVSEQLRKTKREHAWASRTSYPHPVR
ncbi:MAG: hypothetical protein O2816_05080 [Planctomycetota bacterium]|nr:hypothetical protein [Planctomycetota bacterium]